MMKSFFKKLAFVMALAMVVSMAAPAAKVVSAAEDKKPLAIAYQEGAVITALNLAKVGAKEDLRFVYAPSNWKELGATWSSSNENVVSVDANGVVEAKAAGTATISVAVGTETASIEVYSVDMTTFVATMGNKEDRAKTELTLKVGEEFDFAFYGIKDYSVDRYNCEWWAVDPEGVIELNTDNGLVTAKKAGTAKLTLAVMNLVTLQKTDVAACVITVEEEKAAVDPNNFEVTKMITDSKFQLTFENKDITAEEIKANLTTDYYAGTVRVNYNNIKSVDVKDGVAEVQFYSVVGDKVTYVFKYKDIEKEFTTEIGEPASMYLTWRDETTWTGNVAWAGYTTILVPHILNANGTEITDSVLNSTLGKVVEYELVDAAATAQYWLTGTIGTGGIYFAAANATAAVKATFWNGYNAAGERVKAAVSPVTVVTSSEKPMYGFPYQEAQKATIKENYDWCTTSFAINDDRGVDGDGVDYFWCKLVDTNGHTKDVKGAAGTAGLTFTSENKQQGVITGQFSFASDNMNIFTISATGEVKANTPGKANILVYYDPNIYNYTDADKYLVSIVPVTTYEQRKVTTVEVDKNYKTVSTQDGVHNQSSTGFNQVEFKIYLKDQLGEAINLQTNDVLNVTALPVNLTTYEPVVSFNGNTPGHVEGNTLTNPEKGEYRVKFTCGDNFEDLNSDDRDDNGVYLPEGATRQLSYGVNFNNTQRQVISISVVNPIDVAAQNASSYSVSVSSDDWHNDLTTFWYDMQNDKLTVKLYELRNGVKFDQLSFAGLLTYDIYSKPYTAAMNAYYVKITKDGVDVTNSWFNGHDGCSTSGYTANAILSETKSVVTNLGETLTVVDKSLGAGTYTVMAYKAVGTNNAASPSALSLVAQNSITIGDSSYQLDYFKKNTDLVANTGVDGIIKAAFETRFNWTTLNANNGWGDVKLDADYTWVNANTIFFRTITLYIPAHGINNTDWPSTAYVPYTVTVNDYVRVQ